MATIEDLHKSFLDMTEEERFEHIRQVRARRRAPKFSPTKKQKDKPPKDIMSGLTPEMAVKLLQTLGVSDDNNGLP
jgi:hypothetical protein